MKTVYKYPLPFGENKTVRLPVGAEILCVGLDGNKQLCIWAMVDTRATVFEEVPVHIIGTKDEIPDNTEYFDTVITPLGFDRHIFF